MPDSSGRLIVYGRPADIAPKIGQLGGGKMFIFPRHVTFATG
jgi:hypothetical protein